MRIDLLHGFSWDETNEHLLAQWPWTPVPPGGLRCYGGLAEAVHEVVFGTAMFFSHKKNMGLLSGNTWGFEAILPHLYRENFQVQEEKAHALAEARAYVESLKKDTCFVLWCEDHPVVGTLFDGESLDQALNEKRIFSIAISHSAFRTRAREIRPYSVRLCSLTSDLAVALCGARFRSPALAVHRRPWSAEKTTARVMEEFRLSNEDKEAIHSFESECEKKTGFRRLLTGENRLFDRAVLYHPEINAEAVLRSVKGSSGRELEPPMMEREVEILNACRWRPAPHLKAWWEPLPAGEILRGLMIFSQTLAAREKKLADWLKEGEKTSRFSLG